VSRFMILKRRKRSLKTEEGIKDESGMIDMIS
jgi:hypothetical protein